MEIRYGAHAAVPPRGVTRTGAHGGARLVLGNHAAMQRTAQTINARDDPAVEIRIRWIAEWWRKHHRAGGASLVMVVQDLWMPFHVRDAADVRRFFRGVHVRVTIVVVSRILLVQIRNVNRAPQFIRLLHVPVGDHLHAVWIRVHEQDDGVLAETSRLLVVHTGELPEIFDQLLCTKHFARVQAAVDPDNRFPFFRQALGFRRIHALGQRELARDFLVTREILEILGARNNRHDLRPTVLRQADRVQQHAITFVRDLGEVLVQFGVVRQLVVCADFVPKKLFGRGDLLLSGKQARGGRESDGQAREGAAQFHAFGHWEVRARTVNEPSLEIRSPTRDVGRWVVEAAPQR